MLFPQDSDRSPRSDFYATPKDVFAKTFKINKQSNKALLNPIEYYGVDYISPWESFSNNQYKKRVITQNINKGGRTEIDKRQKSMQITKNIDLNKNRYLTYIRNINDQSSKNKKHYQQIQKGTKIGCNKNKKEKDPLLIQQYSNQKININTGFGQILYRKTKNCISSAQSYIPNSIIQGKNYRQKSRIRELVQFNKIFHHKTKNRSNTAIVDLNNTTIKFYQQELANLSKKQKHNNSIKMNNHFHKSIEITKKTNIAKQKNVLNKLLYKAPVSQKNKGTPNYKHYFPPKRYHTEQNSFKKQDILSF